MPLVSPSVSRPQQASPPLARTTQPLRNPTPTSTASVIPTALEGAHDGEMTPFPQLPVTLRPKQVTPPLARRTQVTAYPATTWIASSIPGTWVGVALAIPSGTWLPSWPTALVPKHHTVLSLRIAHVCTPPAARSTTPSSPAIVSGGVGAPPSPSPLRHPYVVVPVGRQPQQDTCPPAVITQVCSAPVATSRAPLPAATSTGVVTGVESPGAIWPCSLLPQQRSPSAESAHACGAWFPSIWETASFFAPATPSTVTAVALSPPEVPLPSSPASLRPEQATVPSPRTTQPKS